MSELLPNRGESRQDWETPDDFLAAVVGRFGPLHVDLACTHANAVAPIGCYAPGIDSLSVPWAEMWPDSTMWLNPEFSNIEPWARKCAEESVRLRRGRILLLTPASVGARWFTEHVHRSAIAVHPISPRLRFKGAKDDYPRDLMLSVFARGWCFEPWRWR